jgi:Mn2+/Fe2+ NRAMP family transporter
MATAAAPVRFARFLPGIFLIGFNIGTGSVTAMAKAGANYGMSLLWALALSALVTGFLIHLFGRFAIVTGLTALQAFRFHLHPAVGWFFIVALTCNVAGSVMGVMGIVAEVTHVWSLSWIDGGIPALAFAALFTALVYGLFLGGTTRLFQNALSIMVALMGICFLANLLFVRPSLGLVFAGLVPRIPVEEAGGAGPAFLVVASMVGTTVFSGLFIIRATLVREAGWTLRDLGAQRSDAVVSAVLMFVLSGAVMAAAAGVFHDRDLSLENVSQLVTLLEPIAGPLAVSIFAAGIIAAGVSSQFPNVLMLPWLLCDYFGWSRDMRRWDFRIMVLIIASLGLVVPLFGARPILVMIASQAFGALIFPATVLCIALLASRRSLMWEHTIGAAEKTALGLIFGFSLYMSYLGLRGLFDLLKAWGGGA